VTLGLRRFKFWLKKWPQSALDIQAYMDPTFATIAAKYDFMTRVLSLGQEQRWKAKAIRLIPEVGVRRRILDLASGTGDFPLHLRRAECNGRIIGLDRNSKMLELSRWKCAGEPHIRFVCGDLMEIPFKAHSFDVVTMGYGLRYVADIRHTLTEVHRLLKRGGIFACLDFGLPRNQYYRYLCFAYLILLGTLWGWVLHRKGNTYWHIVESLMAYPGQQAVSGWLEETGFDKIQLHEQLGGIIVILSGIRR